MMFSQHFRNRKTASCSNSRGRGVDSSSAVLRLGRTKRSAAAPSSAGSGVGRDRPVDAGRAAFTCLRTMKGHARHLMTEHVTSVTADMPLGAISARTMVAAHLTGVPVVDDDQRVIGFVSEADLLAALLRGDAETASAGDVMSQPPIVADEFMPTDEVMSLLRQRRIHHLPVVRLGRLVGIITPYDILAYFVEHVLPIPPEDA